MAQVGHASPLLSRPTRLPHHCITSAKTIAEDSGLRALPEVGWGMSSRGPANPQLAALPVVLRAQCASLA